MTGEKKWYLSQGIWGSVAVLIGVAIRALGYEVNQDELNQVLGDIMNAISNAMTIGGALIALYGRIKATKVVK